MLGFIVFGLVVGVLARLVVPGRQNLGFFATLLLGIAGSVVGGVVATLLRTGNIFELNTIGALVAIATAAALIVLGERSTRGRASSR